MLRYASTKPRYFDNAERGAVGVFPRGESGKDQLAALSQAAAYEIEALPSVVDTKATILRVRIR